METIKTTCPYCGVGCGVEATKSASGDIIVAGDQDHPANLGRLCVKGTALAETLTPDQRLLQPRYRGQSLEWNASLDLIADTLKDTRERYGPGSIAFYLSGQLLTEDYYVANKLMKGFLGSANVDTNSRLCMSSAVSAHKRAFGEDIVPVSYEDVEQAELMVFCGSNAAWAHPVLFQRIAAAKEKNAKLRVVVIDTRATATCDIADLFLQVNPGSDGFLYAGLLRFLHDEGKTDPAFIEAQTAGFQSALQATEGLDLAQVSLSTGVDPDTLRRFYEWFSDTDRAVTLFSQGINQSASGTDKGNAIINCHLATGKIGKRGAGPFSITGQPNAMGGREVGGLATQLAAHRDFNENDVEAVGRFWQATDMASAPGLSAVDLFDAIDEGKIRFLWVMATNPAVSMPDTKKIKRALQRCDFVVVSDCVEQTDTSRYADLVLPAAAWGEKDGTVTNSERVISRQRRLIHPPGQAKPDWWIVTQVAQRLGYGDAFDYASPASIFREHAALSGFENNGQRAFDISSLAHISDTAYETMEPVRWPVTVAPGLAKKVSERPFFTPEGKAQFFAIEPIAPNSPAELVVNSGRLRDQWHTMTRTGKVERLARHRDFFEVQIHPEDAAANGVSAGDVVELHNDLGRIVALAALDSTVPPGQAFTPIHWNDQFTAHGCINALQPSITDPVSRQPQSKFTGAALKPLPIRSWAYVYSRRPEALSDVTYWSRVATKQGYLVLVADERTPEALQAQLVDTFGLVLDDCVLYCDPETLDFRLINVVAGEVSYAMFHAGAKKDLPDKGWFDTMAEMPEADSLQLLAGSDASGAPQGTLICSCWEVSEERITEAIRGGAHTVQALGEKLRCGTQCGSCVPELRACLRAELDRDEGEQSTTVAVA